MARWIKHSLIVSGSILALLLCSMLIVPWQIKKQGIAWIERETERSLSIDKVYFNPFTLTAEISGLDLSEQNSNESFVAFGRLKISVSSRSLLDWALILDQVELDTLHINVEQLTKQEFNFSDFTRLGNDQPAPPPEEPGNPFHFSFNNIVLSDASVNFTDRTSPHIAQHTIRKLNLRVPFVGNIPYLTDDYVEPLLSMLLNGSEIRAAGQLKPFHESIETTLTLFLDRVDLAFYVYHFPLPLPIEVKSGEIDAEIDLSYRISSTNQPKLLLGGELALTDLDLRNQDDSPLFRLPIMILDLDWAEVFKQDINLFSLDFYQPEIYISRDQAGLWSFSPFLPPDREQAMETPSTDQHPPTMLLLASELVEIHQGQIHYVDDLPQGGFSEDVKEISLRLDQFSNHPGHSSDFSFSLLTDRGLKTSINGDFSLNPIAGKVQTQINNIPMAAYYPYLAEQLTAPVEGTLNLFGDVYFDGDGNIRLEQGMLDLTQLTVPFAGEDHFTLEKFTIDQVALALPDRQLTIGAIKLANGDLKATQLADGSLSPFSLIRPHPAQAESEGVAEEDSQEKPADPWDIAIKAFETENLNVQFNDATRKSSPGVRLHQIDFSLQNLTVPESRTSPFAMTFNIADQGSFSSDGTITHSPLKLNANTSLKSLQLADYKGFLPDDINLALADGKLSSTLFVWLEEQSEELHGGFRGNLALRDLNVLDPLDRSAMLTWKNLQLSKIEGEFSPFTFHVAEISLSDYFAKIQITPDGRINLQNVAAEKPDTDQPQEPEETGATAQVDKVQSSRPEISVDTVTLQGGTVSFIDRHLPTHFSTTMYKLGGRISGLSSNQGMAADVDLRGQLENHSPLTVSGTINPLQEDLFADIKLSFEDIDLSPMSGYSGTYLGYMIEKGKLHLNLEYLIDQRKVAADNEIFIDQFTFGEKVESDQATSLPVSLAIALLKDGNDEIHLDVPVSGDLDDPDFSIAGAVFTVLKNLLVKAATSPFALLSSLLGADEDFTSIAFDSGLATLSTPDRKKLEKLAQILTDRPGLKLEISAFVDQENDPENYRKELLRRRLLEAKRADLKKQGKELPNEEELEITPEDYSAYLLQVYKDATFPRPTNFIGMLKELPDSEMEKLLLSNIIVGDNELQDLAAQRAKTVRDALTAYNEDLSSRIFLKKTDIYQPPEEKGAASRVEFGMAAS